MKTIKMKRAHWQAWDAALRSGEYRQGQGRLMTEDGAYCCLGVLQKVISGDVEKDPTGARGLGLPTDRWLEENGIIFLTSYGNKNNSPFLPALVSSAHGTNDRGHTFVEIADAIKDCVEFTDE